MNWVHPLLADVFQAGWQIGLSFRNAAFHLLYFQDPSKIADQLEWFVLGAWNSGLVAADAARPQRSAVLMAVCANMTKLHPEVKVGRLAFDSCMMLHHLV